MFRGTLAPQSRRADYFETLELTEDEDPYALISTSVITAGSVSLCKPMSDSATASVSLGAGLTIPSTGILQWNFPASTLSALEPGPWRLLVSITAEGQIVELVDAQISLT